MTRLCPRVRFVAALVVAVAFAALCIRYDRITRTRGFEGRSQLKLVEIGRALRGYYAIHGRLPPAALGNARGNPCLSWRVAILPFLCDGAEEDLFQHFRLDQPWNSDANQRLIMKLPGVLAFDPGNATRDPRDSKGRTCYLAVTGPGTLFDKSDQVGSLPRDDMDSRKPVVVEVDEDRATIWTKPDELVVRQNKPARGLRGRRAGKCLVLLANGEVIRISGQELYRLVTRSAVSGVMGTIGETPVDGGSYDRGS